MTFFEAMKTHLLLSTPITTLITRRIFPQVIPQQKANGASQVPCITYEQTDYERGVSYCDVDRVVKRSMRLTSWSPKYDEAHALADAVKASITITSPTEFGGTVRVRAATLGPEFDVQDPEPGLHGVVQFWDFWHEE